MHSPFAKCELQLDTDTKDILVEVTSSVSQNTCRDVMDSFIKEVIMQGVLTNLVIEQIKVSHIKSRFLTQQKSSISDQQVVRPSHLSGEV